MMIAFDPASTYHWMRNWSGSKAIIMQAATAYPVARYMDFFDYVPASEIPGVLNRSSILLQLANTFASDGPKGFMTTKLFES